MFGQIKVEFIFGLIIFALVMFFIVTQTNTSFSSLMTDSKSDFLKAKATTIIKLLVEDEGDPPNWNKAGIPVDVILEIDISGSMDGEVASWGENCRLPCNTFGSGTCVPHIEGGVQCCLYNNCSDCNNDGYRADPGESPCSINDAKSAANLFVDILDINDRIGVVAFNDTSRLNRSLDSNKNNVHTFINNIHAKIPANTSIGNAIGNATVLLTSGPSSADLIQIILTDGKDYPEGKWQDPLAAAQVAVSDGIRIYTIGIGDKSYLNESLMIQTADMSGGQYFYSPESTQLGEIYKAVANKIKIRRIGLSSKQPYNLSKEKVTRLSQSCELLGDFDLSTYRLKVFNSTEQILFCGVNKPEPPAVIETRYVYIDNDFGNVTLELW